MAIELASDSLSLVTIVDLAYPNESQKPEGDIFYGALLQALTGGELPYKFPERLITRCRRDGAIEPQCC